MFNISLFLSLCSPSVRLRDYFSAPEGGKEQPDKAGRENTLDNGEEDFPGTPPAVCRIGGVVTDGYLCSKITP